MKQTAQQAEVQSTTPAVASTPAARSQTSGQHASVCLHHDDAVMLPAQLFSTTPRVPHGMAPHGTTSTHRDAHALPAGARHATLGQPTGAIEVKSGGSRPAAAEPLLTHQRVHHNNTYTKDTTLQTGAG